MSTREERISEARDELRKPLPAEDAYWFCDNGRIAMLLRWLRDTQDWDVGDDVISLVEHPDRWTAEYQQMRRES